ncbi:hypothetical protein LELG_02902 [Lodderomyces elongisporus NRRL YB-4239]|uniref:RBR-type E3 ubiquitin transferase n=1 Tax=Lodderomyces elongisporus (strain ATCC 11503 / CBS 2605 / JCM 1781 / NBRC 1676 / NRRL YB-4239) TaxID=379508 RepID=A5DZW5_LODEL|nr:hypothetical protein LELG_02902 [Lodderomyces elongisporus NRRL YB-4239]
MTPSKEYFEDFRIQELESCAAIYDNFVVDACKFQGSISIPIETTSTVLNLVSRTNGKETIVSSRNVHYLHPIELKVSLVDGYPEQNPPLLELHWPDLSDKEDDICRDLLQIWQDYKDQVVFSMLDHIFHSLENYIPNSINVTELDEYLALVDNDRKCLQAKFDCTTFTCEICQSDLKGAHCTRLEDCQHVFCNECLRDYFASHITEGSIDKVHCPNFECTKKYIKTKEEVLKLETWMMNNENEKVSDIVKTLLIPPIPPTVLESLLSKDLVERYLTLFKNAQYELIGRLLPNRLVKCPRIGCEESIFREELNERLVVCAKCRYAFCNDCRMSYHARFKPCKKTAENAPYGGIPVEDLETYNSLPQGSNERKILNAKFGMKRILKAVEEFEMDQLFESLIKQGGDIRKCPSCEAVIEKTEGCNRMKCSECLTCFCFHCGSQIENHYGHFTDPTSPCYKLLFFGMPGTED